MAAWGRLLWGRHWQTDMAEATGLGRRAISRYAACLTGAAEQRQPPEELLDRLRELGRRRMDEIRAALRERA
jgi:hypothetical protein